MHALESFSAVATILGVPRKLNFDSLGGLTIAGLRADEAKVVAEILERGTATKPLLIAGGAQPARPEPPLTKAQWRSKAADSGKIADKPPESPRVASDQAPSATDAPELTGDCGATQAVSESAQEPQDAAPVCAHDDGALGALDTRPPADLDELGEDTSMGLSVGDECQMVDVDRPEEVAALAADLSEPAMPDEPAPQPATRRKKGVKPPPRVEELRLVKLPGVGDKYETVEVVAVEDHPDKGRKLILADGWRVKLDKMGKEVARLEGVPPEDMAQLKTGAELQAEADTPDREQDAAAEPAPSSSFPSKIMETRSSREVVEYLLDNGTPKDDLVGVCLNLKTEGAAAFAPTKDEDGVRRRVNAALAVLGRS